MDVTSPRQRKRQGVGALALAFTAGFIFPTAWAADPKIAFDIPAGEFSQAIIQFYQQSQIEILYASVGSIGVVRTQAVVGELDARNALKKMLEGTGYTFEFESARSVLLHRVGKATGTAEADKPVPAVMNSAGDGEQEAPGSGTVKPEVPEVVVTGSYLHGVLDIMSPLARIERQTLSESAYGTVQDALLALPVNMISGQNENFGGIGNYNRGSAPNLRGLGFGATLVLVNGRRQPAAGTSGDFVDISNIPSSAVDHIDVLTDGASALYGSDAIAGVVNIVLKDRLDGAQSVIRKGSAPDGAGETLLGQLFGGGSSDSHWLLGYQYSKRTELAAADRVYAANEDKRQFGGRDFRTYKGNPGNILDPSTFLPTFAIPGLQDGKNLSASDLLAGSTNLQNEFADYDLGPSKQMHNVFFTASHSLYRGIELFAEGHAVQRDVRYADRPANQLLLVPSSNAFFVDPFGDSPFVVVAYNFVDDLGPTRFTGRTRNYLGTLGAKSVLSRGWRSTLSASLGEERLHVVESNVPDQDALARALADSDRATAFNPFGDGSHTNSATLAGIHSTYVQRAKSSLAAASLIADGPILYLPSGVANLAVGIEGRQEELWQASSFSQQFDRKISSAFAELSLPLVGDAEDPRSIPQLALSVAGRFERYSDFGQTFNPKFGLRWAPLDSLKFRASWGTSFKAPKLVDLYDTTNNASAVLLFPDPKGATGLSIVGALQGSNPDLKQETATSWTAGIDLAPKGIANLTAALTYFNIDYRDQVVQPGPPSPFEILFQEDRWPGVISRDPSVDEVAALCNRSDLLIPKADCLASRPAAIIDLRLRNLSSTRTQGVDLTLDHGFTTRLGLFHTGLSATRLISFKKGFTANTPEISVVDSVGNPLSLRFRAKTEWSERGQKQPGFGATAVINFANAYRDDQSLTHLHVGSLTTFDFQLRYRAAAEEGMLGGVEAKLNATNLFNESPPFVDRDFGFDLFNALPYGRVLSLNIEKSW